MHVEPRLSAFYLDPVFRPHTRFQIDVRLVLLGSLLPRSGEVEIRMRAVLSGVIPSDLIVGTAVGGPEIDVLVSPVTLKPKGDADEPARASTSTGSRPAGQIHFDGSVQKR